MRRLLYSILRYCSGETDYSHVSQYISELNATGSAWSWQIGYLGFLLLGSLGFVLMLVVAPSARLTGVSEVGYWLLIAEPVVYVGSAFALAIWVVPAQGVFPKISIMY